ncbi:uncharacterized protein LOC118734238 [Rhagoletis pomonella]|uniref:uncharacterized protein LOC118734238 n=1 Tax=Rhagoletis pomonella TaxID=28610 RepID=UPI00177C6CB3|nr:uncharacterized protein LOC118734238 [Rhagoletis pomonella]
MNIKNSLEFMVKYNKVMNTNIWCIIVQLKNLEVKWKIGVIYHSPSTSDSEFINYLDSIVMNICDTTSNNVIVGDFNINMNKVSTHSVKLNELFNSISMHQLVDFNTRIAEESQTKIDLLYSNVKNIACKRLDRHKISDHETIMFNINIGNQIPLRVVSEIVSWERYSCDSLIDLLRCYDFSIFDQLDLEEMVAFLDLYLLNNLQQLTFVKQINIKIKNKWYDYELTQLNKRKSEAYNLAKASHQWSDYYSIKKEYKKNDKTEKIEYMENKIITNQSDSKLMWKYLKQTVCYNSIKDDITLLQHGGQYIEDKNQIAEVLNTYFA